MPYSTESLTFLSSTLFTEPKLYFVFYLLFTSGSMLNSIITHQCPRSISLYSVTLNLKALPHPHQSEATVREETKLALYLVLSYVACFL